MNDQFLVLIWQNVYKKNFSTVANDLTLSMSVNSHGQVIRWKNRNSLELMRAHTLFWDEWQNLVVELILKEISWYSNKISPLYLSGRIKILWVEFCIQLFNYCIFRGCVEQLRGLRESNRKLGMNKVEPRHLLHSLNRWKQASEVKMKSSRLIRRNLRHLHW